MDTPSATAGRSSLAGLLVSLMILLVGLELGKTSIEDPPPGGGGLFAGVGGHSGGFHPGEAVDEPFQPGIGEEARLGGHGGHRRGLPLRRGGDLRRVGGHPGRTLRPPEHRRLGGGGGGRLYSEGGLGAAKDTINPLLGASPDPELVHAIREVVLSHPQVVGMHDLIIHDYGPGRRLCSFHAEVPQDADILEAHDAIDHIEREIQQKFGIETTAHMDPIATDDESVNRLREQVAALARAVEPEMTIHDFRVTKGPQHTNLIFDVVVPHRCRLRDEELCERLSGAVRALDERYFAVIQVDRAYVETR